MSTAHPSSRGSKSAKKEKRTIAQLAVAVLIVIPFIWKQRNKRIELDAISVAKKYRSDPPTIPAAPKATKLTSDEEDRKNSQQVKQWRDTLSKQCTDATTKEAAYSIISKTKEGFDIPNTITEQPRSPAEATKRCNLVILDFGANIGDTAGHAIDAGLFTCNRNDLGAQQNTLRFNITSGAVWEGRRNPLTNGLEHLMKELNEEHNSNYSSEDYCYYGIEGNPVFTPRLQQMEDMVMSMTPRPLKHLHFFTDSVGAGEVGMTKLYLDTVNTKQNFWGSSIFKEHGDVKKSALESPDLKLVEADVMGYTITELLLMTMKQFNPDFVPEEERRGGHVLIKVDIEGGEYPLLIEAADSGILCRLAEMGNRVDLFIEFHSKNVIGDNPLIHKIGSAKERLKSCGVEFRSLVANWH